jgi:hypothetical protein
MESTTMTTDTNAATTHNHDWQPSAFFGPHLLNCEVCGATTTVTALRASGVEVPQNVIDALVALDAPKADQ